MGLDYSFTKNTMLSKEALNEFKKIWREEKGEDVSDELAVEEAINLLTLFSAIYRPVKQEWVDEYDRTHKVKE